MSEGMQAQGETQSPLSQPDSSAQDAERGMDREDIGMLFRCIMQFARHLAKKYGFTIRQWPEN